MMIYVIYREDTFYHLALRDDAQALVVALNNPGTERIETWDGRLVWSLPDNTKAVTIH